MSNQNSGCVQISLKHLSDIIQNIRYSSCLFRRPRNLKCFRWRWEIHSFVLGTSKKTYNKHIVTMFIS